MTDRTTMEPWQPPYQPPSGEVPPADANIDNTRSTIDFDLDTWSSVYGPEGHPATGGNRARAQRVVVSSGAVVSGVQLRVANEFGTMDDDEAYVELVSGSTPDGSVVATSQLIPTTQFPQLNLNDVENGDPIDPLVPLVTFTFTTSYTATGSDLFFVLRKTAVSDSSRRVSARTFAADVGGPASTYPDGESWREDSAGWVAVGAEPYRFDLEFLLLAQVPGSTSVPQGLDLTVNLIFGGTALKAYGDAHGLQIVSGPETVLLEGLCKF